VAGRVQIKITNIIIISLLYLTWSCTSPTNTTDLFFYSTDSIRSGDIVLRKSFGLISEVVVAKLNDTLDVSHCGIIMKDSSGIFKVIHSLSKKVSDVDGIQICSLADFMNDSQLETVKIVRYKYGESYKIAEWAKSYLNREVPFDEQFNSKDTTALYCSELPILIIKNCFNTDISKGAEKPKFSIFLQPDYFREIEFIKKRIDN